MSVPYTKLTNLVRDQGENYSKLPKISIVTPSFNQVDFIEDAIVSILEQDYPNLEYIIMDGGSSDGTVEIINKYVDRVSYWQSCPDEGPYHAINEGFNNSTGEIMGWLNSDDMLHRNALWTVAELFQQIPQVQWLCGLATNYDIQGRTTVVRKPRRWSRYKFLAGDRTYIQQESVFWRRPLWEKAGGLNTFYQYAADFELWMRFFRHAQLHTVTTLIGGFRHTPGQVSEKFREEYIQEVNAILTNEPVTTEDKVRIETIRMFNRVVLCIPVLLGSQLVQRIYNRLCDITRLIQYDYKTKRFQLQ